MEEKIVYFDSSGKHNTETTLLLAKERAVQRKIRHVIVSSGSGFSAEKALKIFEGTGIKLTIVGVSADFFPKKLKEQLVAHGHEVIFANEVEYELPQVAITTFRRFCEGLKVCVEIALIATEAGVVPEGEEVIAVGGTGKRFYEKGGGVDTAVVIEAMKSKNFFSLVDDASHPKEERRKIKEIICKPR